MVARDSAFRAGESSDLDFRFAGIGAFREEYLKTKPVILEPILRVEVVAPIEFQGTTFSSLCRIFWQCYKRRGDWKIECASRDYHR